MRMRGWSVVLVFWLGALILGSQAFAASQTLKLQQAAQRRAARSLIVTEVARLTRLGEAAPDSTRRVVEVEGEQLELETVRGAADAFGQPVRLRVLSPNGVRLHQHAVWIGRVPASQGGTAPETGTDVTPVGGASVAGGSASSSPPVSHVSAARAVSLTEAGSSDRSPSSSH